MSKLSRKRLINLFAKRFNQLTYYVKPGGKWLRLDNKKDYDADRLTPSFAILILSRSLYNEKNLTFPITNYVELYRFLKRKYPSEKGYLFTIGNIQGSERAVTLYTLKQPTTLFVAKVSCVIPESLVYGQALSPMQALDINTPNKPLFVVRKADNTIESVNQSALMPDIERFTLATGLPEGTASGSRNDIFSLLEHHLLSTIKRFGVNLLTRKVIERTPLNWKPIYLTVLGMIVGYFSLTSVYLWGANTYYEKQVSQDKEKIDQLFSQQQQLETANDKLRNMSGILASMSDPASAWQLLYELDNEGAGIEQIVWQDNRIIIRGSTLDGAATLLNKLTENASVQRASFEAPVRRRGNRENYRIAVELKEISRGS